MKAQYRKSNRQLKVNLILGILWFIVGFLYIYFSESKKFFDYVFLIMSLLYFALYIYELKTPYFTTEDGMIYKNSLFPKKIKLTDIKRIEKITGIYILKTENAKLTINTLLMDEDSVVSLNVILDKLDLESE
jgi:hypothetical protein